MIHRGRNKEGLTWVEWRLAAKFEDAEEPPRAFLAWQEGEDPTEWAAAYAEHMKQAEIAFHNKEFLYALCEETGPGEYNVVMPVKWEVYDPTAFPKLLTHSEWRVPFLKVGETALVSTIYNPQKQTFYTIRRTK